MGQSSIIAASLVIAFLVFITVRGELPAYFGIFTGNAPAPGTTPGTGPVKLPGTNPNTKLPDGTTLGSRGRITNPNEWTINPATGEVWSPTGN